MCDYDHDCLGIFEMEVMFCTVYKQLQSQACMRFPIYNTKNAKEPRKELTINTLSRKKKKELQKWSKINRS